MELQKVCKKMKHSPSSTSSGSDGEQRTSRKRRKDKKHEAKRKEKKKHRKKRHYSSGSSDSSGSDEEERSKKRRLLKEAKRILKSHKKQKIGASENLSPKEDFSSRKVLTEDDYYEKNKEFSTWLRDERGVYFSNLSADDTRRLFLDFVQAWNSGKLSKRLYGGIQTAVRSDHRWHIKGEDESLIDKEEELEFMKKLEKIQKKNFRNEQRDLLDELLPKATGRERHIEKKHLRKEEARTREESPELMKDQDIMGGSDDFKQRLEKERARREKKVMARNDALKVKQLAAEERESAAMDQFKALLNVAGGKITIPKRAQ